MKIPEWLKHIFAKSITVGATAVLYQGTQYLYAVLAGTATPIEYKALGLIFAYAVWTQAIVPAVQGFFQEEGIKTTAIQKTNYFKLV